MSTSLAVAESLTESATGDIPILTDALILTESATGDIPILTDDALILIFSFLTVWEKGMVACICKRWRDLIQSCSLWKRIIIPVGIPAWFISSGSEIISVILDKYAGEHTRVIHYHRYKRSISKTILYDISKKCPNLQDLRIGLQPNELNEFTSLVFGNELQHLEFFGAYDDCDDKMQLWNIATVDGEGFRHLRSLTVENYDMRPFSELSIKQLGVSSVFSTIHVTYCHNIPDALGSLISVVASTLVEVVISNCEFFSDQSLTRFVEICGNNCRNLEIFKLDDVWYGRENDPDLHDANMPRAIGALGNNSNMRSLVLRGNKKYYSIRIDPVGIRALAHGMVDLKELILDCCDDITDAYITDDILFILGSCFTKLQNLTLNSCINLTDRGLEALSNHPSITKFNFLNFSDKVSRESIVRTICSMPMIEKVDVRSGYCTRQYRSLMVNLEEEIKIHRPNIEVDVLIS